MKEYLVWFNFSSVISASWRPALDIRVSFRLRGHRCGPSRGRDDQCKYRRGALGTPHVLSYLRVEHVFSPGGEEIRWRVENGGGE